MNSLTRATNVLNSTTSFQCITKSLHVFSNITSQADLTSRRSVCFAPNESTQRGGSVPRSLGRNSSNFCIHPEKLKQIIKEKDGQMLCSFFDSDEYKRKVTQISQKQKQMIFEGTPLGVNDEDVRFEHVLSCAQPMRMRKEYVAEEPDAKMSEIKFKYENERVPKKITIMSAILRKKNDEARRNQIHSPERKTGRMLPVVKKTKLHEKEPPKKYKKVSTILPIYLKKMEKNIERRKQLESENETRNPYRETARKILDKVDFDKQVLNVRPYEPRSKLREDKGEDQIVYDRKTRSSEEKVRVERAKRARDRSRKGALFYPDLKLVEYSDYVPHHKRTWSPKKENESRTWPPNRKTKFTRPDDEQPPNPSRNKFDTRGRSDNELFVKSVATNSVTPSPETKKSVSEPSMQMIDKAVIPVTQMGQMKTALKKQLSFLTKKLMQRKKYVKKTAKLSESTKANLPAISEYEHVDKPTESSNLNRVRRRNMSTYRSKTNSNVIIDDVLTLYEKVKTGTSNEPLPTDTTRYPFEMEETAKKEISPHSPSETYRIVKDSRRRREAELKEQYNGASKFGTEFVCIEVVKTPKEKQTISISKAEEDAEEIVKRDKFPGRSPASFVDSGRKLIDVAKDKGVSYADAVKENKENMMFGKRVCKPPMPYADFRKRPVDNEELDRGEENRRLGKRITRPPTPFVDFVKKDKNVLYNRAFTRHLVRLPKTTPEGYRILLYSVRDNDPTKMNFSDCIKGFCMYNDCVLSEDGLQEGYIVIFDMKGVQIGHLARVSLPALRCFLLYIQEAHPCRLKTVHVLNTASWIHHIMRLIVPLVKSEILNLVKFHKGSVPEGFPLELLPMDLGGDAPSIEELDRETKSMIHKYRDWLIETESYKSDESKRLKKAGWWGFFGGGNKANNVELDEKTILKNLQVE